MMERQDKGLAWMLQYENIAWYEDGAVRILDRRVYPIEVRKVECRTHREVAEAIRDMVTQSAGPYVAAAMGMALAAYECKGRPAEEQLRYLEDAAHTISHARPTTTWRMQKVTESCIEEARRLFAAAGELSDPLSDHGAASKEDPGTVARDDDPKLSEELTRAGVKGDDSRMVAGGGDSDPKLSEELTRAGVKGDDSKTAPCSDVTEAVLRGDLSDALRDFAIEQNNERYSRIGIVGHHLATLFPEHGAVMTQCFGETIVGMMLREAKSLGKDIRLFCPETRPYFQGSRLTASVAHDMGYDVTVITDNMPAAVMKNEGIDIFTSAADVITGDGHVINKVGTYQIAICAKHHGVPYYVTGSPDKGHPSIDSVEIEMRDPAMVLSAMGTPTANQNVKGYYPAFDITPPSLVTGVVTDQGVFAPDELAAYDYGSGEFLV